MTFGQEGASFGVAVDVLSSSTAASLVWSFCSWPLSIIGYDCIECIHRTWCTTLHVHRAKCKRLKLTKSSLASSLIVCGELKARIEL